MRWLLNILALIFILVGINAVFGSFGQNITSSLYANGEGTQDMTIEVIYFSTGLIFLGFSVVMVGLAYVLKKLDLVIAK